MACFNSLEHVHSLSLLTCHVSRLTHARVGIANLLERHQVYDWHTYVQGVETPNLFSMGDSMPLLERLISDHQLIPYPASGLATSNRDAAVINAVRFNGMYREAMDIVSQTKVNELYLIQFQSVGGYLYFSMAEENQIGEGRPFSLVDIVAVIRKGKR